MVLRRLTLFALALAAVLAVAGPARAHGMRAAYIEIAEHAAGQAAVSVRTQVPVSGLRLVADAPCEIQEGSEDAPGALVLSCSGTLAGARLTLQGLGPIVSEAVVLTTFSDGSSASTLITGEHPSWEIPERAASGLAVAGQYVGLGVRHIFTGPDHLLFLLGLVLILRSARAVLLAETAFTLSHSLSFSAAALGWIRVSSAAVEATIALSLVLVALEATKRWRDPAIFASRGPMLSAWDPSPLTRARVWQSAGLAFVFGLVHGLGFAGGLAEIGVPERAIPAALAGFAGGVEIGQVVFLSCVLLVFAAAKRRERIERGLTLAATYATGVTGCFWLFERLKALFFST